MPRSSVGPGRKTGHQLCSLLGTLSNLSFVSGKWSESYATNKMDELLEDFAKKPDPGNVLSDSRYMDCPKLAQKADDWLLWVGGGGMGRDCSVGRESSLGE